jgi:hypothetical protein
MHKKHELPGWFPFALVSSFLIMIGAGIKSNWGRPAKIVENTPPPPTTPPVQQAGILHEWMGGDSPKRWFFWYVLPLGATSYGARGPSYMTDQEAFNLEAHTKASSLGAQLYRFVWAASRGVWLYDTRNDPALLASREINEAA